MPRLSIFAAIHINLCTDEVVTMNIDPRTGRLNLRDINSFAIAGRAPRFYYTALAVNQRPESMIESLSLLRNKVSNLGHDLGCGILTSRIRFSTQTILELAEEKAQYLGYQVYKTRNFRPNGNQ